MIKHLSTGTRDLLTLRPQTFRPQTLRPQTLRPSDPQTLRPSDLQTLLHRAAVFDFLFRCNEHQFAVLVLGQQNHTF